MPEDLRLATSVSTFRFHLKTYFLQPGVFIWLKAKKKTLDQYISRHKNSSRKPKTMIIQVDVTSKTTSITAVTVIGMFLG